MTKVQPPFALALLSLLAACTAGPTYVRPPFVVPAEYKETAPSAEHENGAWKSATPQQIDSDGRWWELYGDAQLNAFMLEANASNQTIALADAQYRQARAAVQAVRAAWFPTVNASVALNRARSNTDGDFSTGNAHAALLDSSWEPDLWGRVRRSLESSTASAQASAADLAAARLSIQAELAQDYYQIKILDAQKELFARTLAAYQKALHLTQSQFAAGIVTRIDVALAQSQLTSAQAQAIDLDVQRQQLEHALAILLGKTPDQLTLAPSPLPVLLPLVPPGLPSQLLERRPDIASAERRAGAANASIGVAEAAYFPSISLGASAGFESASLAHWFSTPSRVWSLGATLAHTLFDGGLHTAQIMQAEAAYDAAAAGYKQTVLSAFQEVEDTLAALHVLALEAKAQAQAVTAAHDAEQVTLKQYRAGTAIYLAVVTTQTASLAAERAAIQLLGRQCAASIGLIKAIGGGWHATELTHLPPLEADGAKEDDEDDR